MKKKILVLLILAILLPIKVSALTGSAELHCENTSILPGGSTTCSLTGNIDGDTLTRYQGTIILSDGLELVSVTKDGIWANGENNTANLNFSDAAANTTGAFNIAQIVIKASENVASTTNATLSIGNQTMYGTTDTEGKSIAPLQQSITIASNNNNLSTLTISAGELSPVFNKDTTSYNVTCDNATITISATPEDSGATIEEGTGEKNLDYGANVININVRSSSGQQKVYTLNITRPDGRSTVNTLNKLFLNDKEIQLQDGVFTYEITYDESVSEVSIDGDLTDDKSSFVEGYGVRSENLQKGTNEIEIRVQSEAGSVRTYTLKIIRGQATAPQTTGKETNTDKGITNPKTGSTFVTIILIILLISISGALIYYQKYKKQTN